MRKRRLLTIIFFSILWHTVSFAQRKCGIQQLKAAMIARDPAWAGRLEAQRAALQGIADNYKLRQKQHVAARATAARDTIPVIFHVILNSEQLSQIGGITGIRQRIDSQIAVLNRDYNRMNSDSALIPFGWKHLYAAAGIHFGLAHTGPGGLPSPGYELKIISTDGFFGADSSYPDAKHATLGRGALSQSSGLDAWDVSKYLNVWCINFSDIMGLLGITVAPSFTTGATAMPAGEMGVCISYAAFGSRAALTDYYEATGYADDHYDLGRTLTHEVGHFFEIWHTWGDDGGLCPWNGGADDGLADTPPEGDAKYFNYPDTIPGGTYFDNCRFDGVNDTQSALFGIGSLDFMNYTDDIAMHLFTTDQAAVMAAQVAPGGESYSLTQHPDLLQMPQNSLPATQVAIFPNPTTGIVNITVDPNASALSGISIINMLGQVVARISTAGAPTGYYYADLSGLCKGIYFVRCNFASGCITRKILLQ